MNDREGFAQYTEQAKKALGLAQQEALRYQSRHIDTEHLLLCLVHEREDGAAKVLTNLGVELNKVRASVEYILDPGEGFEGFVPGKIPWTARAKKVIEFAVDEARLLNHHTIGTEHLLLGLLREEGMAAAILEILGITLEKARTQTLQVVSQSDIPQALEQSDISQEVNDSKRLDQFTERAKKVLDLAKVEAQSFQHNYIGTEHLLLGLVCEGDSVAAKVLASLGVELQKVRPTVEFIIGRGDRIVLGDIGLTPRAKKVIKLAADEARRLNHHYVGTEHLLLGLVHEGEGIAAGVLESFGINLAKIRTQIIRVLDQSDTPQVLEQPGIPQPLNQPDTPREENISKRADQFTEQAKKVFDLAKVEANGTRFAEHTDARSSSDQARFVTRLGEDSLGIQPKIDVFISYSRMDQPFVQGLFRALIEANRDAWVDLTSIRPSAKWMLEIKAGIEKASTFIFVLSPDSISSEVCLEEIAHAVQYNKRIIPLKYRLIDPKRVVPSLRKLNWIDFSNQDTFDIAFQQLLSALDTDLDYWHLAAWLLGRARQWEVDWHNSSRLLRGSELIEAERWLIEGTDKKPRPTDFHKEFIAASRLWQTEEEKRQEQQRQAKLARQLASEAERLLNQQPELLERSVLLAAEALRRDACVETYQTLTRGLSLLHQVTYLSEQRETGNLTAPAHMSEVNAVQFSPDGRYLITVGENGSSRLWDTSTGKALAWVSHKTRASNPKVSPDGHYTARVSDEKAVEIQMQATGDRVILLPHKNKVGGIAFSTDGQYLLTATTDGTSYLWDVATGQPCITVVSEAELNTTAISPDSRYKATTHEDRFIEMRDVVSGEQTGHLVHPHKVYDMIFSADGNLLATIVQYGWVLVWNMTNLPLRTSLVHPTRSFHVNIVKCSDSLVTTVSGEEIYIWNAINGQRLAQIDLIGRGALLNSSPVGQYLLALSPNGQHLTAVCDDHCAHVWDLSDPSNIRRLFILAHKDGDVSAVTISPDSRYAATAGSDNAARLWDLTNGTGVLLVHEGPVNSVAFSPDGRYLATASDDGYANIWDTSTPTEAGPHCAFRHTWGVSLVGVKLVVFSPGGTYIATTVQEGTHQKIHIWNIAEKRQVSSMNSRNKIYIDTIWAIAFSPDEKLLASTEGSEVRVWDVKTGDQLRSLPHEGTMHDVAFSPDGNYLIVPAGPHVHIWKATSADLIGRIAHKDSVSAMAFSPDSRYLATASGNTAQWWLWKPEDLIEETCKRVTRNLTLEEWQRYLPDEPYRNTCTTRMGLDPNVLLQSNQKRSDALIRRATRAARLAERTSASIQHIIPGFTISVQYIDEPHPAFPGSSGYFKISSPSSSPSFRDTITDTVFCIWNICIETMNKSAEDKQWELHKELHDQLNVADNTFE